MIHYFKLTKKHEQRKLYRLYKKMLKAISRFDKALGKDKHNEFTTTLMKQYLNSIYGKSVTYFDTDSIKENK